MRSVGLDYVPWHQGVGIFDTQNTTNLFILLIYATIVSNFQANEANIKLVNSWYLQFRESRIHNNIVSESYYTKFVWGRVECQWNLMGKWSRAGGR